MVKFLLVKAPYGAIDGERVKPKFLNLLSYICHTIYSYPKIIVYNFGSFSQFSSKVPFVWK